MARRYQGYCAWSPMKYFDPDRVVVIANPIPLVKPVDPPLERSEPPQVREAREARNNRKEDIYYKDYSIFTEDERKWDRYYDIEAKLRECIKSTVAPQKKVSLLTIYPSRQWLVNLKEATAQKNDTKKKGNRAEKDKRKRRDNRRSRSRSLLDLEAALLDLVEDKAEIANRAQHVLAPLSRTFHSTRFCWPTCRIWNLIGSIDKRNSK